MVAVTSRTLVWKASVAAAAGGSEWLKCYIVVCDPATKTNSLTWEARQAGVWSGQSCRRSRRTRRSHRSRRSIRSRACTLGKKDTKINLNFRCFHIWVWIQITFTNNVLNVSLEILCFQQRAVQGGWSSAKMIGERSYLQMVGQIKSLFYLGCSQALWLEQLV